MWKFVVLVACLVAPASLQNAQVPIAYLRQSPRLLQVAQPALQTVHVSQPALHVAQEALHVAQPVQAVHVAQPVHTVHVAQPVSAVRVAQPVEPPQPYSFGYEAPTEDGGSSSHQQSGDESGRVTGSYTVSTPEGAQRTVTYYADELGFHAEIQTNEPGTSSGSPADVNIQSSAPVEVPVAPRSAAVVSAPRVVVAQQPAVYAVHQTPNVVLHQQPALLNTQGLVFAQQAAPVAVRRIVRRPVSRPKPESN